MLIYKRNINYPSITQYSIFGERHSGTNFLSAVLDSYLSIPRTHEFGHKHWFGFNDTKHLIRSPRTLFINIIRNPYDWINGFYLTPYHIPQKNIISFKNFITKEWYSVNPDGGEILFDRNFINNTRYKNILEMRAFKALYLRHTLPNLVDNYVLIKYEDFISDVNSTINRISEIFSVKLLNFPQTISVIPKHPYKTKYELLNYINNNINWSIENTIGYYQESETTRGY
jgi:hypothetical protein